MLPTSYEGVEPEAMGIFQPHSTFRSPDCGGAPKRRPPVPGTRACVACRRINRPVRSNQLNRGGSRAGNLTIDLIRSRNFPETTEFTINGRRAISTRQFDGPYIKEACTVDVEMKGGSLEFNLNNPPSNRDTGSSDSCVLARGLAEKVVPSLPATA